MNILVCSRTWAESGVGWARVRGPRDLGGIVLGTVLDRWLLDGSSPLPCKIMPEPMQSYWIRWFKRCMKTFTSCTNEYVFEHSDFCEHAWTLTYELFQYSCVLNPRRTHAENNYNKHCYFEDFCHLFYSNKPLHKQSNITQPNCQINTCAQHVFRINASEWGHLVPCTPP